MGKPHRNRLCPEVQIDRGFVIHRPKGPWQATLAIDEAFTSPPLKTSLVACAQHEGPKDMLVALGYAGWGAGQLENEIANNYWLNCPADEEILFHTPSEKGWRLLSPSLASAWHSSPPGRPCLKPCSF